MKKVISSQTLELQNPLKIPLYQQIESFIYWLIEINQSGDDQRILKEILSINDLVKLQEDTIAAKANELEKINKTLGDIKDMMIDHCQLIGFHSLERLFLIEIGINAIRNYDTECLEKLIFLNQEVQPIEYEKKRISPRTKFHAPETLIPELSVIGQLHVSRYESNQSEICIEQLVDDYVLMIKGRVSNSVFTDHAPKFLTGIIKEKKHIIHNLKFPVTTKEDQTEHKSKRRRTKKKDSSIPSEFRHHFINIQPTFKLLLSSKKTLENDLILAHQLWKTIEKKCPKLSVVFTFKDESALQKKLKSLAKGIENLQKYFEGNPHQQGLILSLLMSNEKENEALALASMLDEDSNVIEHLVDDVKNKLILNMALADEGSDMDDSNELHVLEHHFKTSEYFKKNPKLLQWIMSELTILKQMEHSSDTHALKRLERLKAIRKVPFGKTKEMLNQISLYSPIAIRRSFESHLRRQLDQEVHGQDETKTAIIQTIGQMMIDPTTPPKPLLLIGPPGTGKTSLAKSIANVIGREMGFIGLGGEPDRNLLKGLGIGYENPGIGMICQILQQTQQMNPLIVLDEIDKTGDGRDGKATHRQVMELTDPNVKMWEDEYIGIGIDKRQIWFILTANTAKDIDPILWDRVQIIHIEPQSNHEKKTIVKNHIIPKLTKKFKFPSNTIVFKDAIIEQIIHHIPYEAGCRLLEDTVRQVFSNINLRRIATEQHPSFKDLEEKDPRAFRIPYHVTHNDIEAVTSKYAIIDELIHAQNQVGVINGLYAQNNGCGGILKMIITASDKLENHQVTGNLGKTMIESITVSKTVALTNQFLNQNHNTMFFDYKSVKIHLHTPGMGIPKDGPSAGSAITLGILSALENIPINREVAVTGEIDTLGNILAVGGIYEKLAGAKRAGVKTAFIPAENLPDLEKATKKDPELLTNFNVVLAKHITEIIPYALIQQPTITEMSSPRIKIETNE